MLQHLYFFLHATQQDNELVATEFWGMKNEYIEDKASIVKLGNLLLDKMNSCTIPHPIPNSLCKSVFKVQLPTEIT